MVGRRIVAVPLLLIGGAIFLATGLASLAGGLYYTYVRLVLIFDGQVGQGLLFAIVAPMVLTFVVGLLSMRLSRSS